MQTTGLSHQFAGVRGKLTAAAVMGLVALWAASVTAPQAKAQDNAPVPVAGTLIDQAILDAAADYAESLKGIGVYIAVGDNFRDDTDYLVNAVGQAFASYGVETEFFIQHMDKGGTTITYHVGEGVRGPFGIDGAGAAMEQAVFDFLFYQEAARRQSALDDSPQPAKTGG